MSVCNAGPSEPQDGIGDGLDSHHGGAALVVVTAATGSWRSKDEGHWPWPLASLGAKHRRPAAVLHRRAPDPRPNTFWVFLRRIADERSNLTHQVSLFTEKSMKHDLNLI